VRNARAAYFSTNNLDFNRELLDCVADNILVIHNLGIRLPSNSDYLDAMLKKSTLLVGNRIEWSTISSITGLNPQQMLLSSSSPQNILITAGRDGVQLFTRREDVPVDFPADTVQNRRSPVGAGDSFAVGELDHDIYGSACSSKYETRPTR